jgi:hypothetical protein
MRGLVLKGQPLHMTKESDPLRKVIAASLVGAGIRANVYDTSRRYGRELDARQACLRAVVDDVTPHPGSMLILEQDDSLLDWDRRCLYAHTRATGTTSLHYEHRRAATDQLLGIPDAIAWCWAKGGTGDGASLRWDVPQRCPGHIPPGGAAVRWTPRSANRAAQLFGAVSAAGQPDQHRPPHRHPPPAGAPGRTQRSAEGRPCTVPRRVSGGVTTPAGRRYPSDARPGR